MTTLHCYLDETGDFNKNSKAAIGGIWADKPISESDADKFWKEVLGKPMEHLFHAKDYDAREFQPILKRALPALQARQWRPVFFEHATRKTVVDNLTTYVNIFAEGTVAFARAQTPGRQGVVTLDMVAAVRVLPRADQPDVTDRIPIEAYRSRLDERIQVERLRSPRLSKEASWTYQLSIGSARQDRRLMIADLVCRPWLNPACIPEGLEAEWQSFIDPYCFQVFRARDEERVLAQIESGEYGLALLSLLAHATDPRQMPPWLVKVRTAVIDRLAKADARERDAALSASLGRIEAEIQGSRNFVEAETLLETWTSQVLVPLRQAVEPAEAERLEWAAAEARLFGLIRCNHVGDVIGGQRHREALDPLLPRLAGRFERLPLAFEIQINDAVHVDNTFDYIAAYKAMDHLADNLRSLCELMVDVTRAPNGPVRSDVLGKALGTALQAAFKAGHRDPAYFEVARKLSDEALGQFEGQGDRRRQAGYRAQLETDAGELETALHWLAQTVGVAEDGALEAIATAAAANPFNTMHWVRLWEAATRQSSTLAPRLEKCWPLVEAPNRKLLTSPQQHPSHVILWKLGAALGRSGREQEGLGRLELAMTACDKAPGTIIRILGLGAQCDRLAILTALGQTQPVRKGVQRLQETLTSIITPNQPAALQTYFAGWKPRIDALAAQPDVQGWRALAWDIPY